MNSRWALQLDIGFPEIEIGAQERGRPPLEYSVATALSPSGEVRWPRVDFGLRFRCALVSGADGGQGRVRTLSDLQREEDNMSNGVTYLNPKSAPKPGMFSHVAITTGGPIAYIAGQTATDLSGKPLSSDDFAGQIPIVFGHLGRIFTELGAGWGGRVAVHNLPCRGG